VRDGCTVAPGVPLGAQRRLEQRALPAVRRGLQSRPPRRPLGHCSIPISSGARPRPGSSDVWHGRVGVRAGLRRFFSEWEEFPNDEIETFKDGGDKFVVVIRMRGRSRGTHVPTEMWAAGVIEGRDGVIVRVTGHSNPADALATVTESARTQS
jgi:hypothetical protein